MKCKNCNENILHPRNYCPYCRYELRYVPFLPTSVNKRGLIVFVILLTLLITGIYAYKLQPAYISKNLQKEHAALQSKIKTLMTENDGLKKQIAAIKSKKKVQKAEKPKSGEIWTEPSTEMSFVWLEGSESGFEIGCGDWTSDCGSDESPRKGVKLDGFWIGQHEVTVKQWNMFVKEKNYQGSNVTDEWGCNGNGLSDFSQDDDHPVVCVTWNDAKAFADWLTDKAKKEGNDYRFTLPSEAQWEYACRSGGKEVEYGTSTGELSPKLANYSTNEDGYQYTAPVGKFSGNKIKLFDMSGNVWEWVTDIYNEAAYQSNIYAEPNPIYESGGVNRVIRGGGWYDTDPADVRCAGRGDRAPANRRYSIGFRLLRTLDSGF